MLHIHMSTFAHRTVTADQGLESEIQSEVDNLITRVKSCTAMGAAGSGCVLGARPGLATLFGGAHNSTDAASALEQALEVRNC